MAGRLLRLARCPDGRRVTGTGPPRRPAAERGPAAPRQAWLALRDAVSGFTAHDLPRHGAALAFTAVFSVAPLLVVATAVAGLLYDAEAARAALSEQLCAYVGPQGASAVEGLLARALPSGGGLASTILGALTTLFGATTLFAQLKDSLDHVFGQEPRHEGLWRLVCTRLLGLGMVLLVGALLLASLLAAAAVSVAGATLAPRLGLSTDALDAISGPMSLALAIAGFAALFKLLPARTLPWPPVLAGAAVTALLFTAARAGVTLYLSRAGVASAYGAAGSLVAFLVWVYATMLVVLFGAEVVRALAPTRTPPTPSTRPPPPRGG